MARRLIQSGMMKKDYEPRDVDFRDRGSFFTRTWWKFTISRITWICHVEKFVMRNASLFNDYDNNDS